jgi:hypothetical protein
MRQVSAHDLLRVIGCLLFLLLLSPSYVMADLTLTRGTTTTLDGVITSETVTLDAGTDTIDTGSATNTLSGVISGPGALTETGGGTAGGNVTLENGNLTVGVDNTSTAVSYTGSRSVSE